MRTANSNTLDQINTKVIVALIIAIEAIILTAYITLIILINNYIDSSTLIFIIFSSGTLLFLKSQILLNKHIIVKHYYPKRVLELSINVDNFFESLVLYLSESELPIKTRFGDYSILVYYNNEPMLNNTKMGLDNNEIQIYVFNEEYIHNNDNIGVFKDKHIIYKYTSKRHGKGYSKTAINYSVFIVIMKVFKKLLRTRK